VRQLTPPAIYRASVLATMLIACSARVADSWLGGWHASWEDIRCMPITALPVDEGAR